MLRGRYIKTQETTRPGHVCPEVWRTLSKKQNGKAITEWKELSIKSDAERARRGIPHITECEVEAYTKMLSQARHRITCDTTIAGVTPASHGKTQASPAPQHQDNIAPAGGNFGQLLCMLQLKIGKT